MSTDRQQHGGQHQAPTAPPPHYIPPKPAATPYAVDPGAIRHCLYTYTYVWLQRGKPFWFYPTHVGRHSVSGYRWNGHFWMYYGIDLRFIDSFTCV
jgi:hypothetical protein